MTHPRAASADADLDPRASASAAGLHHVEEDEPGHQRRPHGTGTTFVDPDGRTLRGAERERVEQLVIPPAWTDVWIATRPDAHILATGVDDAGRKQYLYHPAWQEQRAAEKFERLGELATRLPDLRRAVADDLAGPRGSPRWATAMVLRLVDRSGARIGTERYVDEHGTFGASTLRTEHVDVDGVQIELSYPAKASQGRQLEVADRQLADAVQASLGQPGDHAFGWVDDEGVAHAVTPEQVGEYLAEVTGLPVTAKDLRTWSGTAVAAEHLVGVAVEDLGDEDVDDVVLDAIDAAAEHLGDTRAVCRASYVHPEVPAAFADGRLQAAHRRSRRTATMARHERAVAKVLTEGA